MLEKCVFPHIPGGLAYESSPEEGGWKVKLFPRRAGPYGEASWTVSIERNLFQIRRGIDPVVMCTVVLIDDDEWGEWQPHEDHNRVLIKVATSAPYWGLTMAKAWAHLQSTSKRRVIEVD